MRYSKKYKFIFLANPKTGSTSVRHVLNDLSDHQELIEQGLFHDHWSALEYKKIFGTIGLDWNSFYRFTTIRSPWKKYVSNYFYSKPDANFLPFYDKKYNEKKAFKYGFREWVVYYIKEQERFPPGCPPLMNFAFSDGTCLVDDIFPIETFERKAMPILRERGILTQNISLPRLNTTGKRDYRKYYNSECIELIAKICSLDIELGEYVF